MAVKQTFNNRQRDFPNNYATGLDVVSSAFIVSVSSDSVIVCNNAYWSEV